MTSPIRRITPKKALLILFDISAALAAILLGCLIYYSGVIPASIMNQIRDTWFLYLITAGFVFYFSGLYDQMWAFASGTAYISISVSYTHLLLLLVKLNFNGLVSLLAGQSLQKDMAASYLSTLLSFTPFFLLFQTCNRCV